MNLTAQKKRASLFGVAPQWAAGVSVLQTEHEGALCCAFFCAYRFMVGVMGALRSAAPRCGNANPVTPATLLVSVNGGSSLTVTEATPMSALIVTAQIRSAVGFIDPAQLDITDLPFVKDKPGASGRLFWDVKPNGNYGDESLIGKAYALDALQYMLSQDYTPLLPWIVADMPARAARSGIEVGFLSTIASYAAYGAAAKAAGSSVKEGLQ